MRVRTIARSVKIGKRMLAGITAEELPKHLAELACPSLVLVNVECSLMQEEDEWSRYKVIGDLPTTSSAQEDDQ